MKPMLSHTPPFLLAFAFAVLYANAATKDIEVSLTPPLRQEVIPGSPITYVVNVTSKGFKGELKLSLTWDDAFRPHPQADPDYSFDGAGGKEQAATFALAPGAFAVRKLTIFTKGIEEGDKHLMLWVNGGPEGTKLKKFAFKVASAGGFTLSVSPDAQTVIAGKTASYTVTVEGDRNFADSVMLELADFSAGRIEPRVLAVNRAVAQARVTIPVAETAPTGTFPITVKASSAAGKTSKEHRVTLNVQPKIQPRVTQAPSAQVYWTCLEANRGIDFKIDPMGSMKWKVRPYLSDSAKRTFEFSAAHGGSDSAYLRPTDSKDGNKWVFMAETATSLRDASLSFSAPRCLDGETFRDIADVTPQVRQGDKEVQVTAWEWVKDDSPQPPSLLKLIIHVSAVAVPPVREVTVKSGTLEIAAVTTVRLLETGKEALTLAQLETINGRLPGTSVNLPIAAGNEAAKVLLLARTYEISNPGGPASAKQRYYCFVLDEPVVELGKHETDDSCRELLPPAQLPGNAITLSVRPLVQMHGVDKPVTAKAVEARALGAPGSVLLTPDPIGQRYDGRIPLPEKNSQPVPVTITVTPELAELKQTSVVKPAQPAASHMDVDVRVELSRPTFAVILNPSQHYVVLAKDIKWLDQIKNQAWRVLDEIDQQQGNKLTGRYFLTVAEPGGPLRVLASAEMDTLNRTESNREAILHQLEFRTREVRPEAALDAFGSFLDGFSYGPTATRGIMVYFEVTGSDPEPDADELKALDKRLGASRIKAVVVRLGRSSAGPMNELAGSAYKNLRMIEFDMATAAKNYFDAVSDRGIELAGGFIAEAK